MVEVTDGRTSTASVLKSASFVEVGDVFLLPFGADFPSIHIHTYIHMNDIHTRINITKHVYTHYCCSSQRMQQPQDLTSVECLYSRATAHLHIHMTRYDTRMLHMSIHVPNTSNRPPGLLPPFSLFPKPCSYRE